MLILLFYVNGEIFPNASQAWNGDRFKGFSVHVHVQENPHEQSSHLVRQFSTLDNIFHGVELVHVLHCSQSLVVTAEGKFGGKVN